MPTQNLIKMDRIITDNSKVNENLLNEVNAVNKQNKELIFKNMDLQEQLLMKDVMHCLSQEIEKLNVNSEHKDWYTSTLQHRLTEAEKQEGNLAIAILNALEDYLK